MSALQLSSSNSTNFPSTKYAELVLGLYIIAKILLNWEVSVSWRGGVLRSRVWLLCDSIGQGVVNSIQTSRGLTLKYMLPLTALPESKFVCVGFVYNTSLRALV